MSDAPKKTTTAPVKLGKTAPDFKPEPVPQPRTVQLATLAVAALIVLSVVEVISLFGFTDQFEKLLAENNADAKDPKSPYGPSEIANDLHDFRIAQVVQTIVVGVALLFLLVAIRRVRSASVGRWALIIVMIMTSGPAAVIPVDGLPGLPNTVRVLMGVVSLAAIILLLLPESAAYFRACKAASLPPGATPRPGLRDLFSPRAAAGVRGAAPAATTPAPRPKPAAGKAKSKTRTDEAIAKGAQLARTRAKASKSRRTDG